MLRNKLRQFVYLVKRSQGLPHEAFQVATKPTLNSNSKITGAAIGEMKLPVASNNFRYNLRLTKRRKKKQKQVKLGI